MRKECLDACIGSEVQLTVTGQKPVTASVKKLRDKRRFHERNEDMCQPFQSEKNHHICFEILKIRTPASDDIVVTLDAYNVPINMPLSCRRKGVLNMKFIVNFNDGSLISIKIEWDLIIVYNIGHLREQWSSSVYYTETKLKRMHRHFYYPSTDKVLVPICLAESSHIISKLRDKLIHVKRTAVHANI